ncbi:hypothetical protein G7070_00995 [Propioniciclava coleopterorum]|uniref:FtsX-like permease family protein n=1 Tax=Propioniciclava coleopterorum TaxID=2714937 RepID=A0A6G7Y3B9_9ACTN|nr:FtsX-like permease family protein [Propioniciclava coleopterorum]QIK71121.1 hypothetical protein G7070_00995 [Propioniciclava coleopterorum]
MGSNTLALSTQLATARLRDPRGTGSLDVFAVVAYGVTAWLAFVVASGTWMFVRRQTEPSAWLVAVDPEAAAMFGPSYVALAFIACALLIVPILTLGGAAARLGARGRARRLASLRLIGMTSGQIVGMSVVESLVQAAAGLVLGAAAWGLSVPLLGLLTFQHAAVAAHHLLMPWWLWLALIGTLLALAAVSTALGLTRVSISPLGVARQTSAPALGARRLLALLAGVAAISLLSFVLQLPLGALVMGLIFAGLLGAGIGTMNLVAPWLLQVLARIGVATGSPARMIAMRRIIADPRGAWRNVSSLALIGVIAGMLAVIPVDAATFGGMDDINLMIMSDIRTGALVTLAIALLVGATSTALTQASDVVDRSDELVALDRMGVPPALDAAARRHQVLMPLLTTLALSLGLGVLASLSVMSASPDMFSWGLSSGTLVLGTVLVAVGLTLAAAEATRPLRRRAIHQQVRRND